MITFITSMVKNFITKFAWYFFLLSILCTVTFDDKSVTPVDNSVTFCDKSVTSNSVMFFMKFISMIP